MKYKWVLLELLILCFVTFVLGVYLYKDKNNYSNPSKQPFEEIVDKVNIQVLNPEDVSRFKNSENISVNSLGFKNNDLVFDISYSGCAEHSFTLYFSPYMTLQEPPIFNAILSHNQYDNYCEILHTSEIRLSLDQIKTAIGLSFSAGTKISVTTPGEDNQKVVTVIKDDSKNFTNEEYKISFNYPSYVTLNEDNYDSAWVVNLSLPESFGYFLQLRFYPSLISSDSLIDKDFYLVKEGKILDREALVATPTKQAQVNMVSYYLNYGEGIFVISYEDPTSIVGDVEKSEEYNKEYLQKTKPVIDSVIDSLKLELP